MATPDELPARRLLAAQPRLQDLLQAGGRDAAAEARADRVRAWFAGEPGRADLAWAAAETLLAAPAVRRRLVVYTALMGAKEALADPLADLPPGATTDLDLDFVCITDNPALQSPVWRTLLIPSGHLPPEKLSRRPKALPHEYFPDAEFSLYVDNTVSFKRLPQAADLEHAGPHLFKAFRHATRSNPEQEAAAVAMLGYDDVTTICRQMAFYAAQRPLADITPLTTATVLLRAHHAEAVKRFGTVWWESILAFSKRDQLSFDFARLHSGCEVEYFEGFTHENAFIRWQGSLSQRRVKASFDERRYAWRHRDDPAAQADPRAHFLQHHQGPDADYQREAPLLEFICQMHGSSLGHQVSPRRGVCEALEPLLAPHRQAGQRWMLLRVHRSAAPLGFEDDELGAAARALSTFMSPAKGTLIDLEATDLKPGAAGWAIGAPGFDAVIVLGPSAEELVHLLPRLPRLLATPAGTLVAVLASPATLEQAGAAERGLAQALQARTAAELHAAHHDDLRHARANSVLALRWQDARAPLAAAA